MSTTSDAVAVEVPDIGDFEDVPIIEILVSPGDTVAVDDPLLTLESDKATMDVPAPFAGTVGELMVKVGDKVSQGVKLLTLSRSGDDGGAASAPDDGPRPSTGTKAADSAESATQAEAEAAAPDAEAEAAARDADAEAVAPDAEAEAAASAAEAEAARPEAGGRTASPLAQTDAQPTQAPPAAGDGGGPVYASPAVRRIARELGVDLHQVTGSGRKGRITKEDVQSFASRGPDAGAAARAPAAGPGLGLDLPPWPSVDFSKFGEIERVQRSRIQRISGPVLARNWVMIPHVTHNDEADITDLEAWRKQLNDEHARDGVKVTMVSFLIVASVATLKAFPAFNASLDGEDLILKRYYNIGFAADTPGGLVVPVIKNADQKGLLDIARELTELSGKAREGKLAPGDMQGASFTISSLGGIGGTSFTPIINAPEVAILGATRSTMKPVWDAARGEFVPRLMVPLSLSYDHRVIDGAAAARFVVHLVKVLSDLRRALL
jgi:pyruvate dehydrogenase E2 component (dihydrolipoamide acetyltransferase)